MAAMGFDMRTAVVASFKFRWRAAFTFLFFVALAVAACLLMKTQYSASSSMLVKLGRELVYRPEVGNAAGTLPAADHDETMASIITIMESETIARQVIDTIGLATLYPDLGPEAEPPQGIAKWIGDGMDWLREMTGTTPPLPMTTAIHRFGLKLKIAVIKRTGIITVEFTHPNPEIAARAANLVVTLFQKEAGQIYDNSDLTAMEGLVEKERAGLDRAQAALTTYQRTYGVYAPDDQINALLAQKTAIDSNMKADAAHIAELRILVSTLNDQRASTPQRVVQYADTARNRVVDDSEAQLLTLRVQERQMATRYAANYPPLMEVRNQIALAEQAVRSTKADPGSQSRTGMNDVYVTVLQSLLQRQAELASYAGRQDAMKLQLAAIDKSLSELSERQRVLKDLQQEVTLRTDAVKASYDKLAEARAIDGLNRERPSSFTTYQEATAPDPANPSRPLPVLYTLVGALFGLVAAVTMIFLSHVLSRSFLTPELASARLNLPVLGVLDYRRKLGRMSPIGVLQGQVAASGGASRNF